jgi:two-component system NarL family sensor kinase
VNRIFTRIFLSYLSIGLSSALIITVIYYFIMRGALIERTYDQLSSINILKKEQIDNYLLRSKTNLQFLFTHDFFLEHFHPNSTGKLTVQTFPNEVKQEINSIHKLYGFSNISVLDGNMKEIFATDHGSTQFDTIIRKVLSADTLSFYVVDASGIANTKSTVLLYIIPLSKALGNPAYIVIEEDFRKLQNILNENTGLGNTGESYLVGADKRLRSESRFMPDRSPMEITIPGPRAASDDDHIELDYRNVMVIRVSRLLGPEGLDWMLHSEIDLDEAMQPVNELRNYLLIIAVLLILVTVAVAAFVSNAISKPIMYLREIIVKLSKGVVPSHAVTVPNRDEVGQIAGAINQLIGGLQQTTQFAYAIGEGKFNTQFEKLSPEDSLGDALMHMRDQIRDLNRKEVQLIREKTAALMEGQENERLRITRELHDGVGQLLTVIRLRLDGIKGQDAVVSDIKSLLAETSAEVRRISFNVMPSTLVDFGLEAALEDLCKQIGNAGKIGIDYQYISEVEHTLSFDIIVAVYRIAQEALNNILKHSEATEVSVHILDKEDEVFMLLQDNGKGFEGPQPGHSGFGLRSMEERAKLLGGSVEVHTTKGKGTEIEVHIPVKS